MSTDAERVLKRRALLKKLLLPMFVCVVGAAYVVSKSSTKTQKAYFNPERNLEQGRRSLAGPYDETINGNLPAWTSAYANVWDPIISTDTPTYWYVNKNGGATVNYVFGYCLGLVLANHQGINVANETLGVWDVGSQGIYPNVRKYVNVRTNTLQQLDNCKSRDLLGSGLADVIMTPYVEYAGANLFNSTYRARGFVMMRHPVKRVVDQFYYRQHATWESNWDIDMATMSLQQFSVSNKLIENFEVRQLLGKTTDFAITVEDLELAKEILRQKFVVGIFEWFDISVVRFEKYFGWWTDKDVLNNLTINWCHFKIIGTMDHVGNYPKVPTTEEIEDTIMTRMWADVELYHYAKTLFNEQAKLL